ncbi:MAG: ABC transporter substrate-binding protein [Candidatus Hermodarchaeota archaeon]
MEALTKRILAIVLIAVIGVGIGVGAWFLLAEEDKGYKVPGAPSGITQDQIIKIGLLGDLGDLTGDGNYKGAYLAAKEVNEAGGIVLTSGTYYFGVIAENTYEAEPFLDTTKGVLAAEKLMTQREPDIVIGGFRTEAVMAYREVVIAEQKLFMNTGAATDSYCLSVLADYAKYKYCFRTMPINSTSLAKEIVEFYALALKPAMEAELGGGANITKVGILREDLAWTVPMLNILNGYYKAVYRSNKTLYWYLKDYHGFNDNPWFNFTIVADTAYPITATSTDFTGYLNAFETTYGAEIVCPIISAQGGIKMMTQYKSLEPNYMIVGIDVMSQLGDDPDDPTGYWDDTNGGCAYEIIMQSTTRTNKTSQTIAFWDAYRAQYNRDPLYTAVGSYGTVHMLAWAIDQADSLDTDDIITQLETITPANTFEGPGGNTGFTTTHDLYEGYDSVSGKIYSVTLWVQWLTNGTKAVVTSGGHIYPEWIVDTAIQVPPWIT